MRTKAIFSILPGVAFIMFAACQKDNQVVDTGNDTVSLVENQVMVTELMEDIIEDVEFTSEMIFGELKGDFEDCRTVTVEPRDRTTWPKTITIDFGTEGCTVREGITKKGKIIIVQSARQNAETWEKVISFDNYFINDNQIEGTHTVSFHIRSGHPVWTTTITGGKVTTPDGVIRTREATHKRIQTRGLETQRDRSDDAFQLTGNASGTHKNGKTFTWTITEPLVISNDCRWIRKGIKEISLEGQSLIMLNFGDGTCDDKASLTQDGETREITLKGFRRR